MTRRRMPSPVRKGISMFRKAFFLGAALFVFSVSSAQAQDAAKIFTPTISPDLHQNFLDIDRNRDGFITFAEFAYAYPRYYTVTDDPVPLSQHFAVMDTD